MAAKADQPGLVRVQRQFERAQSFMQVVQKGLCLMLMLETDDLIVSKAHDDHVAVRLGLAPSLDPQIIPVVQVDVGKDWGNHRTLRSANLTARHPSVLDDADFEPFRYQAQDALVRDTVLEETDDPRVGHGIVKALDIRIEHPVHPLPQDTDVESIQRIMLATPRPEPIGKPDEVLLVDRFQNCRDRLLDDLVLQTQDGKRPLRSIRLRDVCPSGWTGAVAALVHAIVQVRQFLFEVFSVALPRHAVDTRCGVPLKREVAPLQEVDSDVMQQCGEPHTLTLSRRSAHSDKPVRRGVPAQCPGRGRLATIPLGRGPSLHGLRRGQALFVRLLHRSYSLVRLLTRVHAHRSAVAFMSRSGVPLRTRVRSPSFRTKDVSTCMGSPTARGSSSASHCAGRILPSLQQYEIGTSKFDPFRRSIPSPWSPL